MLASDSGSINSPEYGDELIAWNGTVMYSLVTKPAS